MDQENFIEHAEDLYQNSPIGYLTLMPNGKILNVNDTLLKWLGMERAELVSKKSFQDLLNMGGKIYFETHMMPLLQMHGQITEINIDLKGNNEINIPALIYAYRVQHEVNDTPFFRIAVTDITQRKNYERELLVARKEAEDTSKRLKQINEELERFAYLASHDLQAPVNTILDVVQILEKKDLFAEGSREKEMFSFIKENGNRMRTMIKDLLNYSRLGVKVTDFEYLSLNEICKEAIELLHNSIEKEKAVINVSKLPVIYCVRIQIVRLFQNLFSNAIKYRSEAKPVINVTCKEEKDFYKVSVSDNGMGFDQKYEKKIFEFMERLHSQDVIEGTGIGLSASKRIIEMHGGTIGATSELGKGSTFYFTLPKGERLKSLE